jgi:hypothetical protein
MTPEMPTAAVTWHALTKRHAPDAAAMLNRRLTLGDELPKLEGNDLLVRTRAAIPPWRGAASSAAAPTAGP